MTEAIPVAGVNEVVLETIDLESAERFYTEVLGFPVIGRWDGPRWAGREQYGSSAAQLGSACGNRRLVSPVHAPVCMWARPRR